MNSRIPNWVSSLTIALIALQITALPSSADNQAPTQVADSILGASGSFPYGGAVLNGKYYFTAYDPVNGYELRVYDGTNPPSLVQDISPGSSHSFPNELYVFNDKLYFSANDGTNGYELWVHDGTNPATMVQNIRPGSVGSYPHSFTVFNSKLYFSASDGTNGSELWVYDGTNAATMVQNIASGYSSSDPRGFTVFNSKLYFRANDVTNGYELWVYDGTEPAKMVQNIASGSSSSYPYGFTVFNSKLYFRADDGTNGTELWVYDGTNAATMVQDIMPGSASSSLTGLTVFNSKLYFAANDGTNGAEVWVYDGTSATVIDINPTGSGIENMMGLEPRFASTSMGLFFTGSDGTTGFELWSIAPAQAQAPAPAPYAGPLLTEFSSRTLDVCTPKSITITGIRLLGATASVQGKSVTVLENTDTKLVLAFPAGLTPGNNVDLVINSSSGTLTHQDAFDIPADTCAAVLSKGRWTQLQSDGKTVKIYAKDPIGDGKIQFFVDGKEIAWVNAIDEADPKLSFASSYPYLVRSVALHEGKNRFEIKLDGVRVWRATYVPKG